MEKVFATDFHRWFFSIRVIRESCFFQPRRTQSRAKQKFVFLGELGGLGFFATDFHGWARMDFLSV